MFSLRVVAHITTPHNTLANVIKANRLLCAAVEAEWRRTVNEHEDEKRRHGGVKEKIDKPAASSYMTTHKMNLADCYSRPHSPTNTSLRPFLRMKDVSVSYSVAEGRNTLLSQ